jgi:hypothetical protein
MFNPADALTFLFCFRFIRLLLSLQTEELQECDLRRSQVIVERNDLSLIYQPKYL